MTVTIAASITAINRLNSFDITIFDHDLHHKRPDTTNNRARNTFRSSHCGPIPRFRVCRIKYGCHDVII